MAAGLLGESTPDYRTAEVSRERSLLAWMARSTAIWLNPILVRYRLGSRAWAGIDATTSIDFMIEAGAYFTETDFDGAELSGFDRLYLHEVGQAGAKVGLQLGRMSLERGAARVYAEANQAVLMTPFILAGAIAIPTMPVAQYPVLAPPQISVNAPDYGLTESSRGPARDPR